MKQKILCIVVFVVMLISNTDALTILSPGATWEYTFVDPTSDPAWNKTTGIGGIWLSGPAPFGNVYSGDFGYQFGTYWPENWSWGDDLWVRTSVDLSVFDLSSVRWDIGVDNGFTLYTNGFLVAGYNAEGYTGRWEYSGDFSGVSLNQGTNIIAVALEDHGGLTAFDMQITGDHVVSEPSTLLLLGSGLSGLIGLAGLRKKFKI